MTAENAENNTGLVSEGIIELSKWVAYCSNISRSAEECFGRSRELFALISPGSSSDLEVSRFAYQLRSVFINRDYDLAFLDMMLRFERREIAIAAVDALYQAQGSGSRRFDISAYIEGYIQKYGEDRDILGLKLRWLTQPDNYSGNVGEVERVLAALSAN